MCVKIVAECKEYVLLETVAIQDTQDRVFKYSSSFHTSRPMKLDQKREKDQRSGLICAKAKIGEPSRISSISGSPLL